MDDDMPSDPMSSLLEQATGLHELFASFVRAGFSEAQSMQLITTVISAALGGTV